MLTEAELKRLFELARFKASNPRLRGGDFDYQCDNVSEGDALLESFCWYFRKSKYEIFTKGCAWSSRLGYFLFSFTPEYEVIVRRKIAEQPEPDWNKELRAYHSHLCPCEACAEAERRRKSRLNSLFKDSLKW